MFPGLQGCWNGKPLGTFKRMNHEADSNNTDERRAPDSLPDGGLIQGALNSSRIRGAQASSKKHILSWCSEALSDSVIYSSKFMVPSVVVKALYHLVIPYDLKFAHIYLHCILANLATPECTWYFPTNVTLFLFAVVCWDCPSLLLPVLIQFKDLPF